MEKDPVMELYAPTNNFHIYKINQRINYKFCFIFIFSLKYIND